MVQLKPGRNPLQSRSCLPPTPIPASFSPLYFGESTATFAVRLSGVKHFRFQSPLLRGIHCNTYGLLLCRRGLRLSVPSTSGNPLQLAARPYRQTTTTTFSPLYFGESTATDLPASGGSSQFCLSVPSTSGNPLQLLALSHYLFASRFQSPLLRGIHCNPWSLVLAITTSSFQSPLLRGIHCNANSASARTHAQNPFSPLYFGESTATCHDSYLVSVIILSVPSTSGNPLQPWKASNYAQDYVILSVPSTSGNPLQPTLALLFPRFRELSVPSTSGNPLQLGCFG